MHFCYSAFSNEGKKIRGRIEAISLTEAKERLRAQGILVLQIESSKKKLFTQHKKRLKKEHLVNFTSQTAELLLSRIPLYESIVSLEELWQGEALQEVLQSLSSDIQRGVNLTGAMKKFPRFFPPLYLAMIEAGETIGALEKTLQRLSQLLIKQHSMQKKIITTLIYPTLLLAFSCFVIILLLTFVIPSMEAILSEGSLNGFTRGILGLSHFVTEQWPIYLPLFGALLGSIGLFYRKNKQKSLDLLFRFPLIKKMLIEVNLARFSRTLASLVEGGVPLRDALVLTRGVVTLPSLKEVIENSEKRIVEGSSLSCELKKSPLIPPLLHRMIAIGEEGGNMVAMLYRIADFYDEEIEKKSARILALAGPVILLIMGALIGIIMMSILLPLTDTSMFTQG